MEVKISNELELKLNFFKNAAFLWPFLVEVIDENEGWSEEVVHTVCCFATVQKLT